MPVQKEKAPDGRSGRKNDVKLLETAKVAEI